MKFGRWRRIAIAGIDIWLVSREDLILSKLEWARDSRSEAQLRDVRNLTAAPFDRAYVVSWVQQLGLEALWDEVQTDG